MYIGKSERNAVVVRHGARRGRTQIKNRRKARRGEAQYKHIYREIRAETPSSCGTEHGEGAHRSRSYSMPIVMRLGARRPCVLGAASENALYNHHLSPISPPLQEPSSTTTSNQRLSSPTLRSPMAPPSVATALYLTELKALEELGHAGPWTYQNWINI